MRTRSFVCACGSVLFTAAFANAAVILNGSFESPDLGFASVGPGATYGNWTCSGPSGIEFVHTVPNGSLPGLEASGYDGEYWIDLTGVGAPSGIFQDIATDVGQQYRVDFAMAGNVWSGAQLMRMNVLWDGVVVGTFEHNTSGHTGFNMGWTQHSVLVTGSGVDRLQFQGLTGGAAAGAALDAVSITVVPAPGALLVAAAGIVTFLRRRR